MRLIVLSKLSAFDKILVGFSSILFFFKLFNIEIGVQPDRNDFICNTEEKEAEGKKYK